MAIRARAAFVTGEPSIDAAGVDECVTARAAAALT
jgi:hypothetical protein